MGAYCFSHEHYFLIFRSTSSALHGFGQCLALDRREVPSVILDYEDDKENMPNECDYEDLPSMYKDEDDEDDDEEEDDDEDDDSIFTSEWQQCADLDGLNLMLK